MQSDQVQEYPHSRAERVSAEVRSVRLPFEPHIGIGFFGKGLYDPLDPEPVALDSEAFERARLEAAELEIEAGRTVASLTIVRLDTEQNTLENVVEQPLGS